MAENPASERPRRAAEDHFLFQQWLEVEQVLAISVIGVVFVPTLSLLELMAPPTP
jgi:hypothetical protein